MDTLKPVNSVVDLVVISLSLAAYTAAAMFLDKLDVKDERYRGAVRNKADKID